MKKSILMLAAGALLLATPSCKKEKMILLLSLSSRTGRISREWTMTEASWTDVDKYNWGGTDYTSTDVDTYDGTSLKWISSVSDGSGAVADPEVSLAFSITISFEKDGNYSSSVTEDGEVSTEKGYWYFSGKSKAQELKKKEAVVISLTESVDNGDKTTYTGSALTADNTMMIDRLTGKEMVVKFDNMTTYPDADYYSSVGTYNFEKK
ncbi:MAG: hypothetical protein IPM77_05370 [Crocinitomicaceae bacterium]|nr:hypothetical protein [Crocinitomicaceae bacterium]